jgi:acetamidase/formamidase
LRSGTCGGIFIVPVKVEGGGIYIGDTHANQGDGELSPA